MAFLIAIEHEAAKRGRIIDSAALTILNAPLTDEVAGRHEAPAAGLQVGETVISPDILNLVAFAIAEVGSGQVQTALDSLLTARDRLLPAPPTGSVAVHHSSGVTEYVPHKGDHSAPAKPATSRSSKKIRSAH